MELLDGGAVKWTGKFERRWSQIDLNILDGAEVNWVGILGLTRVERAGEFGWSCSQMGWTNGLEYLN
jgi:hypothetical protein